MVWSVTGHGSTRDELLHVTDLVLTPYLTNGGS
jgi:hypothetical protein